MREIPLDKKAAIVFGNELHGLSDYVFENADAKVTIPMSGFTESFNLSVSVAICLYHLTRKLKTVNVDWELANDEKEEILLDWYKEAVHKSEILVKEFCKK